MLIGYAALVSMSLLLALTGLDIDGGIASVNRCIAGALEERVQAGDVERVDRVLLYSDSGAPPAPRRGEQRLARGSQARFVWETWLRVWRQRPDLVFFDHVGLAQTARLPLAPFRTTPYLVFVHGGELEAAREGRRRRGLLGAHGVLTNSHFTADLVVREFPELAGRVHAVPLCIDPARIEAWERDADEAEGEREPIALIVGRMVAEEPGKGHEELIAAWPRVRQARPSAELWIVGGGDDRERLEALAAGSGAAGAVRFLGRVPDAELRRLYRRASVLAMPSQQEGFGLVYAEAMWHGTPCIGSTADSAGEVIGEAGCLVPYGDVPALADALCALLGNPEEARRLGEAGRRRARQEFTYPRFRADLLAALGLDAEPRGCA